MSYNTIYYGSFEDINDDRIDIYVKQKDFGGVPEELVLEGNPLVISYPKKEFYDSLFGCGCEINIINQSTDFYKYDSIFSTPERNIYIEIIKNPHTSDPSSFLFQGYVLPEMYTTTLEKNIRLTISGTDKLSMLDRFVPYALTDTSTKRVDEYVNALDVISNILYDIDVTNKILVNNQLENINYVKDVSSTVFNNVFFIADNFSDKNEIQNNKVCLEKILKSFYSRCYYSDGKWNIERVSDMGGATKKLVMYPKDSSIYGYTVNNTRIDLTDHEMISKSPALTFNPGYQKLVLTLNYKEPESLIENYYWDFKYYTKEVSTISLQPFPQYRKWMLSGTDSSLDAYPYSSSLIESGLLFTGLKYGESFNEAKLRWFEEQFSSTMFMFPFNPPNTTIKINYDVEIFDLMISGYTAAEKLAAGLNTNFALRACDVNGKDWWIAKSDPDDTSTYWKDIVYLFNSSIGWPEIIEKNYLWNIDQTVKLPGLNDVSICTYRKKVHVYKNWWNYWFGDPDHIYVTKTYTPPSIEQLVGELYLDIYPLLRNASTWYWDPADYYYKKYFPYYFHKFGNVDVDVLDIDIPYNVLEASIGYFYEIKEMSIDIFDTSTILFTNGLYNYDASGLLRSIDGWRDKPKDNYCKLQEKYMEDISQMISKPRYGLNVDIRSNDSSLWNLGYIYTHDKLRYPNTNLIDFICNGLQHNVKENTYRLNLLEYIDDDNWRVNPPEDYFTVDPSILYFSDAGVALNTRKITVDTNTEDGWGSTYAPNWIFTYDYGNEVNVYLQINSSEFERDGSVYVTPVDPLLDMQVVSIHQDGSAALAYIDLDNHQNIVTSSLGGRTIDISLYLRADTEVVSHDALYHNGHGRINAWKDGIFLDKAESYSHCRTVCADTDYVTIQVAGITTDTSLYLTGDLYLYQNDEDAFVSSAVKVKITQIYINSGDVSTRYNTGESYYDAGGVQRYVKYYS